MQRTVSFEIKANDLFPIKATYFGGEKRSPHLIIVVPATAAPQPYYRRFAEYAANYADFDALTFDYRSIGKSEVVPVTVSNSTMSDWGERDLQAIINWADKKYDKIFIIGHSVAGQIFPKAANHARVFAAYFIGAQSAYYGHWKGFSLIQVLIFWFINIPLTTFLLGYLPGWTMGGKVSIPSTVALEWRKWGLHPDGVIQGKREMYDRFCSVKIPMHFINIKDDKVLAPTTATRALMYCYKNAVTTYQYIKPKDLGLKKIGHFGFFKKSAEKLWSMPLFFFTQFVRKLDQE